MIGAVRQWLTSIILTSFLISLLQLLLPEGSLRKAGAFTGSLVLLTAIVRPLARLEPDWPDWNLSAYESAIAERMDELNAGQEDAFAAQVAERTVGAIAAYSPGVSARVTVRVQDGVPLPWAVTLSGAPDAELSAWLAAALDIPPERQFWTDSAP